MCGGKIFSLKSSLYLMTALLIFGLISPATLLAGEDGYIIESLSKSEGMGQPPSESLSKTYMTPTKLKVGFGDNGAMIFDVSSQLILIISHAEKDYYTVSMNDLKPMIEGMMAMMTGDGELKVERSGEKKKIGDWNCEKVVMTAGGQMGMTRELWISKDAGIDVSEYMEVNEMLSQLGLPKQFQEEMKKIDGYPVLAKTIMTFGPGMSMTTEERVQSIKKQTFSASTFAAPEGYVKKEGNPMQAMQDMQAIQAGGQ